MRRKIDEIVSRIVKYNDKGLIRCGLCGRGTFTRRGFYLHIIRVHRDDIIEMLKEKS